jgi:hypothetical protein
MRDEDPVDQDKTKIIQPRKTPSVEPVVEQPPAPPVWESSQPSIPVVDEDGPSLRRKRRYGPVIFTLLALGAVGLLAMRMVVPNPGKNIEASISAPPPPPAPVAPVTTIVANPPATPAPQVAITPPAMVPSTSNAVGVTGVSNGHHQSKGQFFSNLSSTIERTKTTSAWKN